MKGLNVTFVSFDLIISFVIDSPPSHFPTLRKSGESAFAGSQCPIAHRSKPICCSLYGEEEVLVNPNAL